MSELLMDTPIDNVEAWSGKVRSDENFPLRAVLRIDMRVQRSVSP